MAELMDYVDRMYHTVMNKDVALEYCKMQISVLQKELDQSRVRSEDDRKSLIGTLPFLGSRLFIFRERSMDASED
jgi:hypothetical protein